MARPEAVLRVGEKVIGIGREIAMELDLDDLLYYFGEGRDDRYRAERRGIGQAASFKNRDNDGMFPRVGKLGGLKRGVDNMEVDVTLHSIHDYIVFTTI